MKALLKLALVAALGVWGSPWIWAKLSNQTRAGLRQTYQQAELALAGLARDIRQVAATAHAANVGLMQPGLWSISAAMNMGGQAITNAGQQCITPERVQEILSGGAQALIQTPNGGGCQIQQNLQGQQLVGNGQCTMGGAALQMALQVTFDTPNHFWGRMSEGIAGQPGQLVSAQFEGRRIGDCNG